MTFALSILGSSSALPTAKRFPTAHVLNVHERFFLIDCGEGAQIQLRKQKIRLGKIHHIFISHLHGDHYFGLFGLLSSLSLLGRDTDIHIYAPEGLEKLINCQFGHSGHQLLFNVAHHPLSGKGQELIYEDSSMTVSTIPLKHNVPACGFLFREKQKLRNIIKEKIIQYDIPINRMVSIKEGADLILENGVVIPNSELTTDPPPPRSYAYCSDTLYNEEIIPLIRGVDLLYHEATFAADRKERAPETYHSTAAQAATIALKANVKQLVIGHFSARYKDITPLLDEAKSIFANTAAAEDGMVIGIFT